MAEFIEFCKCRSFHEWISNVTLTDVYASRREEILKRGKEQRQATLEYRLQCNLDYAPDSTRDELGREP